MTTPRFDSRSLPSDQEKDVQLARSDALSALGVWVLLEGLSLGVLAFLQTSHFLPPENKLVTWFLISAPFGTIGAVCIGVSSWLVKRIQEQMDRSQNNKSMLVFLSQALGWLGLGGVGLPMAMVGIELLSFIAEGRKS
jgi:ABC-type transport system involved in multi-copper enzyme maturation permease subunit